MKKVLIVAILAFGAPAVEAGTIATYNFTGLPGDEPSVAVGVHASNATFGAITRGGGVVPNIGLNSINSRDWNVSTGYYDFTITPNAGQVLHLASLMYTDRRSPTYGPTTITVKFSTNGFSTATTVASYHLVDPITNSFDSANHRETLAFSAFPALTNLTGKVEFRIFATGTTDGRGTYRLGVDASSGNSGLPANLVLNSPITAAGGPAAVPEPSGLLLLALGLVGAGFYGCRRRLRVLT
jgi:hypothetical protein